MDKIEFQHQMENSLEAGVSRHIHSVSDLGSTVSFLPGYDVRLVLIVNHPYWV